MADATTEWTLTAESSPLLWGLNGREGRRREEEGGGEGELRR